MHVQLLPVALAAVDYSGDDDQLILGDVVPNAALFTLGFVAVVRYYVQFESRDYWDEEEPCKAEPV